MSIRQFKRHPWVLAGRTYFKFECLPRIARVKGYSELPQGDLSSYGLRSQKTADSVEHSFDHIELRNLGDGIPARLIAHPNAYGYPVPSADCVLIFIYEILYCNCLL